MQQHTKTIELHAPDMGQAHMFTHRMKHDSKCLPGPKPPITWDNGVTVLYIRTNHNKNQLKRDKFIRCYSSSMV